MPLPEEHKGQHKLRPHHAAACGAALRLYMDAVYAIAVKATAGIISGFATAAITSASSRSLQAGLMLFAIVGALLTIRLWRMTRKIARSKSAPPPPRIEDDN
jgi:membrane protein implicated in regulation of membrane protease activity